MRIGEYRGVDGRLYRVRRNEYGGLQCEVNVWELVDGAAQGDREAALAACDAVIAFEVRSAERDCCRSEERVQLATRNQAICQKYADGVAVEEIARNFKLSKGRIQQLTRTARPNTEVRSARFARIVAARESGRTLRDVGREFDLSPERVRQICAKYASGA
jgi:hypothetical protein